MKNSSNRQFDLKDRILRFIMSVINLTRKLFRDPVNAVLVGQIIRSATSIGANFEEADGSRSKKEFISTMGIVKKEAKETKYWLKIIRLSNDSRFYGAIDDIGGENEELIKIFAKIIINAQS